MRVTDLADSLDWEKGRVAHQLTRMERRGLLERSESGAAGRRTGIALTKAGRAVVDRAVVGHGGNIRRLVLDRLSSEQAAAINAWSRQLIDDIENLYCGDAVTGRAIEADHSNEPHSRR